MAKQKNPTRKLKLSFALDFRLISTILLLVIAGMLVIWKPWSTTSAEKTIAVTGEAVIEAAPDEYQYSPSFTESGASTQEATELVTALGEGAVAKLKALGVNEDDIRTDVYSFENLGVQPAAPDQPAPEATYQATYTITLSVADRSLAQKITSYLATTGAQGSITPSVSFSEGLRKQLDLQAREQATADARTKAELQAEQLEVGLGNVISVSEDLGQGIIALDASQAREGGPTVLPGKQELRVRLTITFAID